MFRTRTQVGEQHDVTSTAYYRTLSGGKYYYSYGSPVPWSYDGFSSRITDVPGPRRAARYGGGRYSSMKPCFHHRSALSCNEGLGAWVRITSNTWIQTNECTCIIWYGSPGTTVDVGEWCSGQTADLTWPSGSSIKELWDNAKPTMSTRANLSVFLAELRDVKRMFSCIPSRHFSFKSWRDVLGHANREHLRFNFGIKPFVRDVQNTFRAMSRFEDRLGRFIAQQNQDLRVHRVASPAGGEFCVTYSFPYPFEAWQYRLTGTLTETASGTFHISYRLPNYSAEEMRWRAYADALGLHASLGNIWAVIPWSFVADWFVDIGSALDRNRDDWVQPWIDMFQCCRTMKRESTFIVEVRLSAYSENPWNYACTYQQTSFSRTLGLQGAVFEPTELNADRVRLLSSLVASRIL